MNSDIERFIKAESRNAYNYFGAHKVSDGACFRVYAPHAKKVEVCVNDKNYQMEKIDFRGVFEKRVQDIKEFDNYHYEILTSNDVWVNKNDPFTFYNESNKSLYIDKDEYVFDDKKWLEQEKDNTFFNACLLNEDFDMDSQRDFVEYLKTNSYNYVILRPYDKKFLYSVDKKFINESSLKRFIDNLHQVNIGVIFDFDTETFFDDGEGLNDFDGEGVYNNQDNKYKDLDIIYFDYSKETNKSYISSFINYYIEEFHGDGIFINDSEINKEILKNYKNKLVIIKQEQANFDYIDSMIEIINNGFDYKKFMNIESSKCLIYDYNKCFNQIKGNEKRKKDLSILLMALCYISNNDCISVYCENKDYVSALAPLADLHKNNKALYNKDTKNILLNGKKNNYFAFEYSFKKEYVLIFVNFSDSEGLFDLGMSKYGYYKLVLDTTNTSDDSELFYTRNKKIQNKDLAIKVNLQPNQALIFKRMKDI